MATDFDARERRRPVEPVREVPLYDWDSLRRTFGESDNERSRLPAFLRLVFERLDRFFGRRVVSKLSEADLHRLAYLLGVDDCNPDREDGEL